MLPCLWISNHSVPAGIPTAAPTVLAPEISEGKLSEKIGAVMMFGRKRGKKKHFAIDWNFPSISSTLFSSTYIYRPLTIC